jgi:hypothetical protein
MGRDPHFFTRPITASFILLGLISIALPLYRQYKHACDKRNYIMRALNTTR